MRKLPDLDSLHDILNYNPETGVLKWKIRPRQYFNTEKTHAAWNARFAGKPAGTIFKYKRKDGIIEIPTVKIFGKLEYLSKYIVYKMYYEKEPEYGLVMKDDDPFNLKIANIVESDVPVEFMNRPKSGKYESPK